MRRARPRQHARRTKKGIVVVNRGVRKHHRRLTTTVSGERAAQYALKGEIPKDSWWTDDKKYERVFAKGMAEGFRGPVHGGIVTVEADLPDDQTYRDGRHWRLKEPTTFRDKTVRPAIHAMREVNDSGDRKAKYILIARTGKVVGNQEGYDTPGEALRHPASTSPYTFLKKYYPKEGHDGEKN